MVFHPAEYMWSSFRANAQRVFDKVLTPHFCTKKLRMTAEERQNIYQESFRYQFRTGTD